MGARDKLFFHLLLGLILEGHGQLGHSNYTTKVSPGAYLIQQSPSAILYESFIPLIYEYHVPFYTAINVTLRDWRGKCESDSYAPSYTCPVFFHFERFLERFENEVVPRAWLDPTTNRSTSATSQVEVVKTPEFCNTIQDHFKERFVSESPLKKIRVRIPSE